MVTKREFWMNHVNRHRASGQTAVKYAAEHNLDIRIFYSWMQKLKLQPNRPFKKVGGFMPIVANKPKDFDHDLIIPLGPGVKIVIDKSADIKDVLGKFLIALLG